MNQHCAAWGLKNVRSKSCGAAGRNALLCTEREYAESVCTGWEANQPSALVWQKVNQKMGWVDADEYCASLTGGSWRLPLNVEFGALYKSGAKLHGGYLSSRAQVVFIGDDSGVRFGGRSQSKFDVLCVMDPHQTRQMPEEAKPFHAGELPGRGMRYTTAGGTVYDTKTKLTWQQTVPSTTYTWANAKTYCAGVGASLGGTWRLPTLKELRTIVDHSQSNPSIDSTAFPSTPAEGFWSSSPVAGSPSYLFVDFGDGTYGDGGVAGATSVRCVR